MAARNPGLDAPRGATNGRSRPSREGNRMNPTNLLKQDHRTVKALFRRFERASKQSEKQRIGEEIIEELSVHAIIEEQLVYPLIRADKRMEELVLNALEEHNTVKLVLAELDKMKADDERYDAKMHVVSESVEMHIEEEEGELLPRLDKLLGAEEKTELARKIVAMKQAVPNHPHPAAPDTPPGGLVAGLVAKLLDAAKDIARGVTSPDKARGHRRVRSRAKAEAAKGKRSGGKARAHSA